MGVITRACRVGQELFGEEAARLFGEFGDLRVQRETAAEQIARITTVELEALADIFRQVDEAARDGQRVVLITFDEAAETFVRIEVRVAVATVQDRSGIEIGNAVADRKSTRLNSSH